MVSSGLERELEVFRSDTPAKELKVAGTDWHYRLTAGTGPAVLMIHGGGGSAESLFRYANRLAPRLQLLLPSIPGTLGTVEEALTGIRAIMARIGIAPSHFVGFSMGGMLEQVMLREAPDGIRSLTLFHCPPPSPVFADWLAQRSVFMGMPAPLLGMIVRWRVRREFAAAGLEGDELRFWVDHYSSPDLLARTKGHQRIVLDYLRNVRVPAYILARARWRQAGPRLRGHSGPVACRRRGRRRR